MPLPSAVFKRTPDDFMVDEIDAYAASAEGSHTLVRIRKRGLTTDAALTRLARALDVDQRAGGSAGLKDKDAVTTQQLSVPGVDPAVVLALQGRWPDLDILEAARHPNKLKPGHLRGNRFAIRLHDLPVDSVAAVRAALERIGAEGCPNAFGPQRFGRDGDNADRALAFVRGEGRPPRDPRERRFLFSALQSRWFNRVLDARVADGTWATPQLGDLLKKHPTGGLFSCTDEAVDRERAARGEVSPTGPIFGAKMARPAEPIFARELAVLTAEGIDASHLEAHRALGEGTRRALRLLVEGMAVEVEDAARGILRVTMTLPKGSYATTVLQTVVELRRDPAAAVASPDAAADEEEPEAGS
ncbi:MAG: tRNA pseudouridine(13) synthase TruD [Polyangiales bacterium]